MPERTALIHIAYFVIIVMSEIEVEIKLCMWQQMSSRGCWRHINNPNSHWLYSEDLPDCVCVQMVCRYLCEENSETLTEKMFIPAVRKFIVKQLLAGVHSTTMCSMIGSARISTVPFYKMHWLVSDACLPRQFEIQRGVVVGPPEERSGSLVETWSCTESQRVCRFRLSCFGGIAHQESNEKNENRQG